MTYIVLIMLTTFTNAMTATSAVDFYRGHNPDDLGLSIVLGMGSLLLMALLISLSIETAIKKLEDILESKDE